MNARVALSRRDDGGRSERRVEAAGAVDAQNASTPSLENAKHAFPTAPTRKVSGMIETQKLLPMSPDRSVTQVAGRTSLNRVIQFVIPDS